MCSFHAQKSAAILYCATRQIVHIHVTCSMCMTHVCWNYNYHVIVLYNCQPNEEKAVDIIFRTVLLEGSIYMSRDIVWIFKTPLDQHLHPTSHMYTNIQNVCIAVQQKHSFKEGKRRDNQCLFINISLVPNHFSRLTWHQILQLRRRRRRWSPTCRHVLDVVNHFGMWQGEMSEPWLCLHRAAVQDVTPMFLMLRFYHIFFHRLIMHCSSLNSEVVCWTFL